MTLHQPVVSIITPSYQLIEQGRKESFSQMVASVHDQDYPHIQHIVVDGGSTDGTKELIQSFADQHMIDRWVSQKDQGLYDAMNKGTQMASGTIVGTLNSDDYYHDASGISRMVAAMMRYKADYAYSRLIMLDPDTNQSHRSSKPNMLGFVRGMPFAHPGFFLKKTIFESLGGYDLQFKMIADNDLITRMLLDAPYQGVCVKHPFITFRLGGISTAKDGSATSNIQRETAQMYRKLYGHIKAYSPHAWQKMAKAKSLSVGLLWALMTTHARHSKVRFASAAQIVRAFRKAVVMMPSVDKELSA